MGQPFVGEIRLFAGNFAPAGWEFCDGRLLQIAENDALFQLLQTRYGGDGQETFALPDLRGRLPIHQGHGPGLTNRPIGEAAGVETVTLTTNQIPTHSHTFPASTATAGTINPQGNVIGQSNSVNLFRAQAGGVQLAAQAVPPAGGGQPHDNMQPYVCINFIISLFGIFPSPA